MSKQQLIASLVAQVPEEKLDTILTFVKFILYEEPEVSTALLSEPSLAKDWLSPEEDEAWKNL